MKVYAIAVVCAVLGMTSCSNESIVFADYEDNDAISRELLISIDADGRIQLDGMTTRLEEFREAFLTNVKDERANVTVAIHPQTRMGMVFDLSNRLPLDRVSSISYTALTDPDTDTTLRRNAID